MWWTFYRLQMDPNLILNPFWHLGQLMTKAKMRLFWKPLNVILCYQTHSFQACFFTNYLISCSPHPSKQLWILKLALLLLFIYIFLNRWKLFFFGKILERSTFIVYRTRAIITRSWILTIRKARILQKKNNFHLLKKNVNKQK